MRKDLLLVGFLVVTLTLMAVPVSQSLIDVFLAINISFAMTMLFVSIYLKRPSDFSTFPSVILIGTAFRLALSIGTTRLILSDADAGQIVDTFGEVVVAGSIAIGLVIFLIITVVQFLVITKGAERVAEVAARFALDALPGKQMSIDAEVRAGNIDADEGSAQRAALDKDSQFFGAMDGAMKFVKGDSIAGLVIICINLVGGIIVGISLHGYTFGEAVNVFSLLTIGDGLVSQFPALLMSLCAGIMVTRVANEDTTDLGNDISNELVSDLRVPSVTAAVIFTVGLVPGFPLILFASIAVLLLITVLILRHRNEAERMAADDAEVSNAATSDGDNPQLKKFVGEDPNSLPFSDRFTLALSRPVIDNISLADLEQRLLRKFWALYQTRGIGFPRTAIIENAEMKTEASITLNLDEVPILNVEIELDHVVLAPSDLPEYLSIFPDVSPIKLKPKIIDGYWIPSRHVDELAEYNISTMSIEEVIAYIAFRSYENNLGSLFSVVVLERFLEKLRETDQATMALIEEEIQTPAMLKMFRYLVEDGVPLRPASLVISSLYYWIHNSEHPNALALAECLRASMKRQLCYSIAQKSGVLGLAVLDPALEIAMRRSLSEMEQYVPEPSRDGLFLDAETTDIFLDEIKHLEEEHRSGAFQITIVASADLRRRVRNFLATNDLQFPVLAPHEVTNEIPSFPIQVISAAEASLENRLQSAL